MTPSNESCIRLQVIAVQVPYCMQASLHWSETNENTFAYGPLRSELCGMLQL